MHEMLNSPTSMWLLCAIEPHNWRPVLWAWICDVLFGCRATPGTRPTHTTVFVAGNRLVSEYFWWTVNKQIGILAIQLGLVGVKSIPVTSNQLRCTSPVNSITCPSRLTPEQGAKRRVRSKLTRQILWWRVQYIQLFSYSPFRCAISFKWLLAKRSKLFKHPR